jgi:hypothetical protein
MIFVYDWRIPVRLSIGLQAERPAAVRRSVALKGVRNR